MTREQLRRIDALVAKLLGWTWDDKTAWSPTGSRHSPVFGPDIDPWWWLPHYSTDIAAAWEVVEKLQSEGFHFALHRYHGAKCWCAQFDRHYLDVDSVSAGEEADTAPLAICLAGLKAKGIEI